MGGLRLLATAAFPPLSSEFRPIKITPQMTKRLPTGAHFTAYTAIAGVILGLVSLLLTVRWHQQSLAEKILVRLNVAYSMAKNGGRGYDPTGSVNIAVINIGMRPIYLQQVQLQYSDQIASVPLLPGESTKPLAPGQPAKFTIPWNLAKYPFRGPGRDDVWVHVQTTRMSFDIPESQTEFFTGLVVPIVVLPAPKKSGQPKAKTRRTLHAGGVH